MFHVKHFIGFYMIVLIFSYLQNIDFVLIAVVFSDGNSYGRQPLLN